MMTVVQDAASTSTERWSKFQSGLAEWEKNLDAQKAKRDLLQGQKVDEELKTREAEAERTLCEQAEVFLRAEIKERRRKTMDAIADLGTTALQQVYGDGYSLRFAEAGDADNAANLRLEIEIVSLLDGEELATGLLGERGGGVVEVVAFALRIAALGWRRYEGPLILDEAYKSMSADDKIGRVADFLSRLAEETGRQVLFATHKADVFGRVAKSVVLVSQAKGEAHVQGLSEDERVELVSQETDDPTLLAPQGSKSRVGDDPRKSRTA